MKLILSRKGFDSAAGGVASPIFEGGRMLSLPIPIPGSGLTYDDVSFDGGKLGGLVADLTRGKVVGSTAVHLDPDLRTESRSRLPGWRPMFGQDSAAQAHLRNQGVGPGDIFLFYGWFSDVEGKNGHWDFISRSHGRHVIFGWLEVGEAWNVGECRETAPDWAREHPHFADKISNNNNTVYIAGLNPDGSPRAGVFEHFHKLLQLSADDVDRSRWSLPVWFHPDGGKTPLTYNRNPDRWGRTESRATLNAAYRGQEFVLDCAHYPEAVPWCSDLIKTASLTP